MAGKQGPEAKLIKRMREKATPIYGARLVLTKYHGSQYGESGVSDLLGVLDGVMIACEVKAIENYSMSVEKALKKGPTTKQKAYLRRVAQAGGVATVAVTEEQFLETLEIAALQAKGITKVADWMDVVWEQDIICTCVEVCEHETDDGCFYCRTADHDLPCPNLD